ncbi:MAG: FIG01121840: hypothetical protein, partial [uncultured Nocardioidaceae bacterium]
GWARAGAVGDNGRHERHRRPAAARPGACAPRPGGHRGRRPRDSLRAGGGGQPTPMVERAVGAGPGLRRGAGRPGRAGRPAADPWSLAVVPAVRGRHPCALHPSRAGRPRPGLGVRAGRAGGGATRGAARRNAV